MLTSFFLFWAPTSFLPQDLCICCFWNTCPSHGPLSDCLLLFVQVFAQISPPQRVLSWPHFIMLPILPVTLPQSISFKAFIPWNYLIYLFVLLLLICPSHFFLKFYFYFILLYNTVLVLPYIDMNLPRVYMSSQSWIPLPPPTPYHLSGSSPCTSPKHPVSCIEHRLALRFLHGSIHVSMPFSQIILRSTLSLSLRVQKSVLYICVSFAVSHTGSSLPSF